jgi:hypothetical protein
VFCAAVAVGGFACTVAAGPASAAPAGNPFGELTADQIASKAVADFDSASSVHVDGYISASGKTGSYSMLFTQNGCAGSVQMGGQGSSGLVAIGSTEWIRPSKQLWESLGYSGSRLAKVLGKWVKVPSGSDGTGSNACDIQGFAAGEGYPVTGLSKGRTVRISGHLALQLAGKKATSYYVSVATRPEILSIDIAGISNTFSSYNAHVTITAPPSKDVVPGGL